MLGRMTVSTTSWRRRSVRTSGSCWVETTTVRTRFGHAMLVLDGDLGLAVRSQVGELAALADLREAAGHPVRERDRQRHQLGRLAAREPEHHPLVARAELVVRRRVVPDLERLIDAHRDVARLLLDRDERAAGQVVEAVVGARVPDVADGVADDGLEVDVDRGADLAQDHDQAGRRRRLARDAGVRVAGDDRVEDRVRDLVAHLVGMAFGHGFGREEVVRGVDDAGHQDSWCRDGRRVARTPRGPDRPRSPGVPDVRVALPSRCGTLGGKAAADARGVT